MTPAAIIATAVLAGRVSHVTILADSEQDCRERWEQLADSAKYGNEPRWCEVDGYRWFGASVHVDGVFVTVATKQERIEVAA